MFEKLLLELGQFFFDEKILVEFLKEFLEKSLKTFLKIKSKVYPKEDSGKNQTIIFERILQKLQTKAAKEFLKKYLNNIVKVCLKHFLEVSLEELLRILPGKSLVDFFVHILNQLVDRNSQRVFLLKVGDMPKIKSWSDI